MQYCKPAAVQVSAIRRQRLSRLLPLLAVAACTWLLATAQHHQAEATAVRGLSPWLNRRTATATAAAVSGSAGCNGTAVAQPARIAVVMVAVGFKLGHLTVPAWRRYAERHGYEFVLAEAAGYDSWLLGVTWWRVRLVHNLLASGRYDLVLHVDADSLPARPEISVGDWVGSHGGPDTVLWLSEDIGKRRHAFGNINFGVFLMRRDALVLRLLEHMWRQRWSRWLWPAEQGAIEDAVDEMPPGGCWLAGAWVAAGEACLGSCCRWLQEHAVSTWQGALCCGQGCAPCAPASSLRRLLF